MKQIVCLSTSPWHPIPTRKQQVMRRIPDAEILYFDPPVSLIAKFKDPSARAKAEAYRAPGETIGNITVYSLPPVWPFFNKFRWINRRNQKMIAAFVRKKMAQHHMAQPVLWCYSPTGCDAAPEIPHSALIYDCVDRHSAYGGLMNPAVVDEMELSLAKQADQVFATAQKLRDRLARVNPGAIFLPNGADYARFSAAAAPQPMPEDLRGITGPIFGFIGALQSCIAYDFLEAAVAARPDWSFVLIGGEKPGVDLSRLHAAKNVHFLGLKPNEQLPQYLAHFDVCLNLFDNSPLSRDVSPLKFYEYLATGKPIVSTPQPEQVLQYRSLIHIAATADEFISACAAALRNDGAAAARMAEGEKASWDSRVAQMCQILSEEGIFSNEDN
ncbi:MAG: glycosyltransferase [Oscillospiraceae bacterium]|nr:glycosyltransferase [Oscillospiraceae bacterium]